MLTQKETTFNPILDWAKHLIFPLKEKLDVSREAKNGGDVSYTNYDQLEKDFSSGSMHPMDLKMAMANALVEILEPARTHFSNGMPAKYFIRLESLMKT